MLLNQLKQLLWLTIFKTIVGYYMLNLKVFCDNFAVSSDRCFGLLQYKTLSLEEASRPIQQLPSPFFCARLLSIDAHDRLSPQSDLLPAHDEQEPESFP
jgi:hypothetical protein